MVLWLGPRRDRRPAAFLANPGRVSLLFQLNNDFVRAPFSWAV